ncbi:MAG: hypothetical protein NC248_09205 [Bacteroides sp.]|nr:hypothetical protein [Bacteroides sp.]MCM1390160.1 hypothetical protein [Bacteroides sp.]
MGLAVGCVGMTVDDFCGCYYDEFESICRSWSAMTESKNRDSWERMRFLAAISIQPHVKRKLTPKRLLPLPWDEKDKKNRHEQPELSADEKRMRFERLLNRNQ